MNAVGLVVLSAMAARRVGGSGRRSGHGRRVLRLDEESLSEWRHRGRGDPLGEAFVVDECDVENPQPFLAASRVEILTARLKAADVGLASAMKEGPRNGTPRVFVRALEDSPGV